MIAEKAYEIGTQMVNTEGNRGGVMLSCGNQHVMMLFPNFVYHPSMLDNLPKQFRDRNDWHVSMVNEFVTNIFRGSGNITDLYIAEEEQ